MTTVGNEELERALEVFDENPRDFIKAAAMMVFLSCHDAQNQLTALTLLKELNADLENSAE